MTPEETLCRSCLDAFNRHDLPALMACFHKDPIYVAANGDRAKGRADVTRALNAALDAFVDGQLELREWRYDHRWVVSEWSFVGTNRDYGKVRTIGANLVRIVDGKIKEMRDYHQPVPLSPEGRAAPTTRSRFGPARARHYR